MHKNNKMYYPCYLCKQMVLVCEYSVPIWDGVPVPEATICSYCTLYLRDTKRMEEVMQDDSMDMEVKVILSHLYTRTMMYPTVIRIDEEHLWTRNGDDEDDLFTIHRITSNGVVVRWVGKDHVLMQRLAGAYYKADSQEAHDVGKAIGRKGRCAKRKDKATSLAYAGARALKYAA